MSDKNDDKNKTKKSSKKPDLKLIKTSDRSDSKNKIRTYKKNSQRPNARQYDREKITGFVCYQIAQGRSLRSILDNYDDLTSSSTFLEWMGASSDLAEQYAHARQLSYQLLSDEIIAISDENYTKVYGEKLQTEHTGKGGGPIQLAAVDLRNLSDSELDDMQKLLDKVGSDESS